MYVFLCVSSWPAMRVLFRYRAFGMEHLPASGGYVLAANHTSNLDPWPLAYSIVFRRYVRFMAKRELFWFPLGWVLRSGGSFPVERRSLDRAAIDTAIALAQGGSVIGMFPEGTRRTKGRHKRFEARAKPGAALIALGAGVPLVPAAISGTDRLARLGPLRVRYGAPVPLDDLAGLNRVKAARIATERLMEAIGELEATL
jgi:1-acyl-sn-glycerol-3-phosphate acyltransferase